MTSGMAGIIVESDSGPWSCTTDNNGRCGIKIKGFELDTDSYSVIEDEKIVATKKYNFSQIKGGDVVQIEILIGSAEEAVDTPFVDE